MSTSGLIHYIFVRKDLPLGVICAQVTHAAGESASQYTYNTDTLLSKGTTAVVLEADNEAHLHKIEDHLKRLGFYYSTIFESSGVYAGQFMAIGVFPLQREYFGDDLIHYRLLKSCVDITLQVGVSSLDTHDTNKKGDTPS